MKRTKPLKKHTSLIVAGAFGALIPALALGNAFYGSSRPAPTETRPQVAVDTMTVTSAVPLRSGGVPDSAYADRQSVEMLKSGLDAVAARDIDQTRAIRDEMPAHAMDRHILDWAMVLSGGDKVSSTEIATTAAELPGWPGMEALRRNMERALYREQPDPRAVVQALGGSAPLTAQGAIILARAQIALGNADAAHAVLSPFWRTTRLEAKDEQSILQEFGAFIPVADHRYRMERMLYDNRAASADRIATLAGVRPLAVAWTAVLRGDPNAAKLIDAVPEAQRGAGFLFAQVKYLRRQNDLTKAAAIMLKAPRDRAELIDPDAWWVERRALARELVDAGDIKLAYTIVAAHSAESPTSAADAEFHAGWYALRGLKDARTAATHFERIAQLAEGPITLSRAYYWLGRAAEAGDPGNAKDYFSRAASYSTAFYGQLAAARIGRTTLAVNYPAPTSLDRRTFSGREAVQAIRRLEDAGYASRADILYRDLADQLSSPGELALLAATAEKRGNHFLALRVAKAAANRGIDIGALSHPIGAIPDDAAISGAGKALAYAIARQESEFNVAAVSGAGARGLLQLMPATAKELARKAGLPYSQSRLTSDAGYNATLGSAFLSEQLGRFEGSYVLTFAGYNAGPRRAAEWVKRYGDPRGKDIDTVVDWIERIPYTETRSYVQRVMENYQVYKARLSGKFDIAGDLMNGR